MSFESPAGYSGAACFPLPGPGWLLRKPTRTAFLRTIQGHYTVGDLTLITAAIMQAMSEYSASIFDCFHGVADQALFTH